MRYFMLIITMIILILSTACTSAQDDITSPATPERLNSENNLDTYVEECRANMRTIAGQAVIHYAINGTYPADMEEMGQPYSEMTCPECGLTYEFFGDHKYYFLNCPMPSDPTHGFIDNGVPSWTGENPDPSQWENICRANMRTIASQAVMYFANHNKFPTSLEDIGMSGVACPACGQEIVLIGSDTTFYVGCPMPEDPNHGYIDNDGASW